MARKENLKKSAAPKKKETMMEFISSNSIMLVIALFIITFSVQTFGIPSSSMENTLLIGDHVLVDRITLGPKTGWAPWQREIRRGDIIVFYSVETPDMHLVKRVIAVPGDRIHLRDGTVYLNGVAQKERYVVHSQGNYNPYRDNFPAVPPLESGAPIRPNWLSTMESFKQGDDLLVPPNSYFAMGDNRDVSWDSRYWGFVPRSNIIGSPLFIYWSFDATEEQYLKTGFLDQAKFMAHEALHFFDKTRWGRMLHPVH